MTLRLPALWLSETIFYFDQKFKKKSTSANYFGQEVQPDINFKSN